MSLFAHLSTLGLESTIVDSFWDYPQTSVTPGVSRACLMVDYLHPGAFPVYEADVNSISYVWSKEKGVFTCQAGADKRIFLCTSEISTPNDLGTNEIYSLSHEELTESESKVAFEEDEVFIGLLDYVIERNPNRVVVSESWPPSAHDAANGLAQVEVHDLMVRSIVMNPLTWEIFKSEVNSEFIDVDVFSQLLHPRHSMSVGKLWEKDVYVSPHVPMSETLILSDPEFVGVIPVRQDITIMVGTTFEEIGMAILNPYAISSIVFGGIKTS